MVEFDAMFIFTFSKIIFVIQKANFVSIIKGCKSIVSNKEDSHLYIYVGIDHYLEPTHTHK